MEVTTSVNTTVHPLSESFEGTPLQRKEPLLPQYVTIYVTIINLIIFMVGVIGNILVIVVVARVKDMRTNMNLYLVNLSVADLLVLLVCQPTAMLEFYAKERWYLGLALCKLVPVLEHSVLHASTLTIMVITFERYHAICRPLNTFLKCNRPRPLAILLCVWTTAITSSLPFLAMTHLNDAEFYDGTPCKLCATRIDQIWQYCFLLSTSVVFFVIPLFLLSGMYSTIIHKLYRSDLVDGRVSVNLNEYTGYNLRTRRQVIRMLITLIVLFFLSMAPLRVVIVWQVFSPPTTVLKMGIEKYYNLIWMCRMLMYLNSAGNPLIYSLLSCKFKIAFYFLLRCQGHMLDRRNLHRSREVGMRGAYRRSLSSSCRLPLTKVANVSYAKHTAITKYSCTERSLFHPQQMQALMDGERRNSMDKELQLVKFT